MKHPARILASTALGLLMASQPSLAETPATMTAPLLLAQADDTEARKLEEERAAREAAEEEAAPAEEQAAPQEEAAPVAEPEAPAAESTEQEAPTEAEAPTPEPAPAEERAPVEEAAPAEEAAPEAADEPAAAEEAAPAAEEAAPAAEEAAPVAEEAAPAAEEAAPAAEPRARGTGENRENRGNRAGRENRATRDAAEGEPAAEEAPAADSDGDAAATPPAADAPRDAERTAAPADDAASDEDDGASDAETADQDALPENAAPVLDSAKEPAGGDGDSRRANRRDRNRAGDAAEAPAEDAGPAPTSDEDAQAPGIRAEEVQPITATEGRRMDRDEVRRERSERRERRGRPEGSEVVRETEGRVVIQFGRELFVESNELPRLSRDARDVYYEELPRGRVRETIVRPNGAQIVTIRNRHGEIVRRSRITPEGREIVLSYVAEENWDRERDWRDPGEELPPLQLNIPVREYILDAGRVNDVDSYYDFLDQPPVERARRLYSVDEVKRSARLRDTVRRVDLDTITFATGSADISRSEVDELEGIADAMLRLLDENPAETFLIEGHTDAVGSDISNLALSDARAESAASALTQTYGIPPENLVTQGYGERYLKVSTEGASRENRRVAIRRITPLVTPVASAQ
ncbi:OmpA family protein [Aquibium sp. ELW1220]|uniref:OmpA family protein n=1 Tax=Aquibium sp. ELW1220 TaxID=2976766 RepID=UPI0025AEDC2D|nr:OmpA family protein [Aquibium sp. ELW1220]MDN2582123.1 OmpA family protein [Aquibium sp. ELW1220]